MADINARMLQRRGTAAAIAVDNPLLESGEMVLETDTLRLKVGNNADLYNDLPYINPQAQDFSAYSGAAGPAFAGIVTTLPLATERFASVGTYTLAANQVTITINAADNFYISADVVIQVQSGSNNNGADAWLERNAVEEPGTRMRFNVRPSIGASGTVTGCFPVTTGDVIRLRAVRTNGTANLQSAPNGVRLTIQRKYM